MKVGNLVQIIVPASTRALRFESRFAGLRGLILLDHSPARPPDVGRVVDVLWENGEIEDMYTDDLEVISD